MSPRHRAEDATRDAADAEASRASAGVNRAAALRYAPGDAAPTVVAKGSGFVADEIVRRAVAAGVPRVESEALANALVRVELDAAIPPELYLAVAEVLAWVYRIDANARRSTTNDATRN